MSRPLVSRADLLRLSAAWPEAALTAARLTGYQPEDAAQVYETKPAQAAAEAYAPQFWRLRRRERLSGRTGRPAALPESAGPLSIAFAGKEPPLPAPQPALTTLVAAAARLRPQPRRQKEVRLSAQSRLQAAERHADWLEQAALRLIRAGHDQKGDAALAQAARSLLELLPEEAAGQYEYPSLLYGLAYRDALRQGAAIPGRYRPEAVLRMVQEPLPPGEWLLVQEGEGLVLVNGPDSGLCLLRGSQIAVLDLGGDVLILHRQGRTETVPVQTRLPLCPLRGLSQLRLQSTGERLHLEACVRPSWAVLIGRTGRDLAAEALWLGRRHRLRWQAPCSEGEGRWGGAHGPVTVDDFGLSAYLGFHGRVMQRFRWIEPGRFLMGSPASEPEREVWGKETQHEVVLTHGFWLGETAVTQELWQFVMRANPARFRSSGRPVEGVSWDDVQHFLQRLNAMAPGLAARLPTEAEWEYACRAGTATPFAFGAQITSEQVNYNGGYPYQGGGKGVFRRETVPAGSLPANAWGLREMHGNLWEWCYDLWQDDLGCDPMSDPQGPDEGEFFVVRGGSWFLAGKGVRSAVRGRFTPEFRSDRVGFRIACGPGPQPAVLDPAAGGASGPLSFFVTRILGRR